MSVATIPLHTVRHYLSGRRGWIVAPIVLAALGIYLGWGWLVAAGIAPIAVRGDVRAWTMHEQTGLEVVLGSITNERRSQCVRTSVYR
jgi:hypothetical protein